MFNKITRMIRSPKNSVHSFVKVSLPAIDGEDAKGNWKAVVDPKLSSQDILNTLLENWTDDIVKEHMFSRFIAVLADDPIRNEMIAFINVNPDASQEEIDEHCQNYADLGWNQNLRHPSTDRSLKSVAKKQEQAGQAVSQMSTEAKQAFIDKLLANDPDLKKLMKK